MGKAAFAPLFLERGTAAGLVWAVFWLALRVWEAAAKFRCCCPEVSVSFNVDDTPLEAEDDCPVRIVEKLAVAATGLVEILENGLLLEVA